MTSAASGPIKRKGPSARAYRIIALKKCIQIVEECDKRKRRPIKKTHRVLLESLKREGVI